MPSAEGPFGGYAKNPEPVPSGGTLQERVNAIYVRLDEIADRLVGTSQKLFAEGYSHKPSSGQVEPPLPIDAMLDRVSSRISDIAEITLMLRQRV